jgi:hypothetical protein
LIDPEVGVEFKEMGEERQSDAVLNGGGQGAGENDAGPILHVGGAQAVVLNKEIREGREEDEDGGQHDFLVEPGCGSVLWDGRMGSSIERLGF